jgi:hypothetical protein
VISIVTWLLALASGLLSYLVGKLHLFVEVAPDDQFLAMYGALLGLLLCVYVGVLIYGFGRTMRKNWENADTLAKKSPATSETTLLTIKPWSCCGMPRICWWMWSPTAVLAVFFLAGFGYSILCP